MTLSVEANAGLANSGGIRTHPKKVKVLPSGRALHVLHVRLVRRVGQRDWWGQGRHGSGYVLRKVRKKQQLAIYREPSKEHHNGARKEGVNK